jgi:hypothetical protein
LVYDLYGLTDEETPGRGGFMMKIYLDVSSLNRPFDD